MKTFSPRLKRLGSWRVLRWALAVPLLTLALWACNSHSLEAPKPIPEQETDQFFEVNPIRDVDILFMIDNSPSMKEEQENLAKNFPAFMQELEKVPGGLPNVQIGVISSDLGAGPTPIGSCTRPGGDQGIFQAKAGCGLDPQARWIVARDGGSFKNFNGMLPTVFSCMATLGVLGCGFEHQLQAMRVALYENAQPANKGFLRPDAFLALIMLTDEDDCSAEPNTDLFAMDFPGQTASLRCNTQGHLCQGKAPPNGEFAVPLAECKSAERSGKLIPVADFVRDITALKKRPDQLVVAGIFGWPNNETGAEYRFRKNQGGELDIAPACSSSGGVANPAVRMRTFVDAFGANGTWHSICQDDLRPAMKQIGEKVAAKIGVPCIGAVLADTDQNAAGIQPECQVIDRRPVQGGYQDAPVAICPQPGDTPCWSLTPDAMCTASGFKITVDRKGKMAPPGTQQAIKCLTCAKYPNMDNPRCAAR